MAILGIGVDLLSLPRLEHLIQRRGALHLAKHILSPAESDQFHALDASGHLGYLALRWTAKEAAFKAQNGLRFRQMTVSKLASGAPRLETALDEAKRWRWHLSVSHDAGLMTAFVVLEEAGKV